MTPVSLSLHLSCREPARTDLKAPGLCTQPPGTDPAPCPPTAVTAEGQRGGLGHTEWHRALLGDVGGRWSLSGHARVGSATISKTALATSCSAGLSGDKEPRDLEHRERGRRRSARVHRGPPGLVPIPTRLGARHGPQPFVQGES
jgi:hypothetical protein